MSWPFGMPPDSPPPAPAVPVADRAWYRSPQVRLSGDDPPRFLVRCGDYVSPILMTDDPWKMTFWERIGLAFAASPGATAGEPRMVGYDNFTGLLEDDFEWREWEVAPTPANVAALRSVGLHWDEAAAAVAMAVAVPDAAVEAVRDGMRRERVRQLAEWEAFTDRLRAERARADRQPPA